jgi:hypothetical protein
MNVDISRMATGNANAMKTSFILGMAMF